MHSDLQQDPLFQQAPTVGGCKYLEPALLLDVIGQGGMGAVYLGYHLNLKCPVAVKCMLPLASGTVREELIERFHAEATMAASISSPHLVRVLDVKMRHGVHYIVLEYVDGETIDERVRRRGAPMSVEAACAVAYFAALGLETAHARSIVHRDIKPSNVLISKEGVVKILDLGIAKSFDTAVDIGMTRPDQRLGTPQYMPPELFEGAQLATPASDVYSLGATLAYMLVGQDLIERGDLRAIIRQVDRGFPNLGEIRPDLPRELVAIVARATTAEPAERYPDAGEFAAALREFLGGTPDMARLADPKAGKHIHALKRNRPPTRQQAKALLKEAERLSLSAPAPLPSTVFNQGEPAARIPSARRDLVPAARPSVLLGRTPMFVGMALLAAALGVGGWFYFHDPKPPSQVPENPGDPLAADGPSARPDGKGEVAGDGDGGGDKPDEVVGGEGDTASSEVGRDQGGPVQAGGGDQGGAAAGPAKVLVEFAPTTYLGSFDPGYATFREWFAQSVLTQIGTKLVLTESAVEANWVVYFEFKSPATTVAGNSVIAQGDFHVSVLESNGGRRTPRIPAELIVLNKTPSAQRRDKSGALQGAFQIGLVTLQQESAARTELTAIIKKAVSP